MTWRTWLVGSTVIALGVAACAPLPSLEAGVCGNGVIDANEDCDEPNGDGISCGSRFAVDPKAACRYVCSPSADDPSAACRTHGADYRCGSDGICRRPSGTYSATTPVELGPRIALEAGDFDGDGASDVAAMSEAGTLDVLYSGRTLAPGGPFVTTGLRPTVGALNADRQDDLAHITGDAMGVLLGQADRSLLPVSYAPFPGIGVGHVVLTKGKRPDLNFPLCTPNSINCSSDLELATYALDDLLVVLNLVEESTTVVDPIRVAVHQDVDDRLDAAPFGYANLGLHDGAVVTGRMSSANACDSIVLPALGSSDVYVAPLCKEPIGEEWTDYFAGPAVSLPPLLGPKPIHVAFGALTADFDGNGALDLLIGSDLGESSHYRLFVAFNDGTGRFWSRPSNGNGDPPKGEPDVAGDTGIDLRFDPSRGDGDALPLAAGDLDGDGRADLVLRSASFLLGGENNDNNVVEHPALALSGEGAPGSSSDLVGRPETGLAFHLVDLAPGHFHAARIGDFNADGRPDVAAIAADTKAVTLFHGNGAGLFNRLQVVTQGAPQQLAVGDFDGDFIDDVAIAEEVSGASLGSNSGCPTQPQRLRDADGSDLAIPYRPYHHGNSVSVLYGRSVASPEPPLRLGEFRCVEHMTVGDVARFGVDTRDELLVLGDDALGIRSVAAFTGAGSRQLESAYAISALPEGDFIGIRTGALSDGYEPLQAVVVPPRDPKDPSFAVATLLVPTDGDGFDVPYAKLAFVQGARKSVPQIQEAPLAADVPPQFDPGSGEPTATAGYPCAQSLVPYAGGVVLVDFDAPDKAVDGTPIDRHQLRLTRFSAEAVKDPLMLPPDNATVPVVRVGADEKRIQSIAGADTDEISTVTVADLAAYRRCMERSPAKTAELHLAARATLRTGFVAGDPAKEDLLVLFHQPASLSPDKDKKAASRLVLFLDEDLTHGVVIEGDRLLGARAPVTLAVVPGSPDRPADLVFADGSEVVIGHLDVRSSTEDASVSVVSTASVSSGAPSRGSGTATGDASGEGAWSDALVVGDFDGDGVLEFAALIDGRLTVFHGNGEVP